MRYTVNQIRSGDDELILNYKQINAEVEAVLAFMEKHHDGQGDSIRCFPGYGRADPG